MDAVVLLAAAVTFGVLTRIFGFALVTVGSVVLATCLLPIVAIGSPDRSFHVGIANAHPEWRTYTVLIVILGIPALMRFGLSRANIAHLLFLAWLGIGTTQFWPDTPLVSAGVLQLATGVMAWSVGSVIGKTDHSAKVERGLILILVGLAVLEVVVCLLQFVGVGINQLSAEDSWILGERVNGTANHPNNLGKLMLVVLLLLLPLTESRRSNNARWALLGSIALFVPFGLAQGRANLLALVCALLLWALLSADSGLTTHRFAIVGATLLGIGASLVMIAARFEEDPEGGVRGEIMQIAVDAIPENFWTGVGANSYVEEIAQYGGSYIPVHNSFALLLAEVGAIGLALFLTPIVVAVLRAVPRVRINPYARALVAVTPGWMAIGWTGWGVLGTSVLCFVMFGLSYTNTRVGEFLRERDRDQNPGADEGYGSPSVEADIGSARR